MRVTIVTVWRGATAETYVAAVLGAVTEADRARISAGFEIDEDEEDDIGFQEVEAADTASGLSEVLQAFP